MHLQEGSMKKAILVPCILLAGCAAVTDKQCASDWYEQGHQEAMMGNRPSAERYAQCSGFQDRAYAEGWAIGYSVWNQRISGGRM
jgi:hypothetical protein